MQDPHQLIPRHLGPVVAARLREEPVVVLTGPRTAGKSTLLGMCSRFHGVPVIDLDESQTRRLAEASPDHFVSGQAEPVCIDEFQHVPELLGAIKAELNKDLRPGRYLLTGSTRYEALPRTSQSLTGRAHLMSLWPLSQGELRGHRETFIDMALDDPESLLQASPSLTERTEYERMVLAGGFPVAISREGARRDRWFVDFVKMVIERDVLEIRRIQQRRILPVILRILASRTGGLLNVSDVASQVSLDRRLVSDYIALLEAVFLVHRLDAFGRTLATQVGHTPKIHVSDSGLAASVVGVTERKLHLRDPAALTEFGHILETFAVNELIKQAGWAESLVEFSHFRARQEEVDLIIETYDGSVLGIEIKAKSTIDGRDFRGLALLRDKLGSKFVGGIVLNLGKYSFRHDEGLYVMPLDRLWTPPSAA